MKRFCVLILAVLSWGRLSAQTQAEMNASAAADYKKADAELNRAYKELLLVLDKNEKKLLVKAQRNWISFRDTHCDFEAAQFDGGSIQPLIRYNCLKDCTDNRTKDLKASLSSRKN